MDTKSTDAKPTLCANNWRPSPAVMTLRADHDASTPGLGAERAIHYTEFYKSSRNPSAAIQKAKALAYHLAHRSIQIFDGEMIVGHHTEHRIGAICYAELAGVVMLEDIFRFETRPTNPLYIDPISKRKLLLSVIPYWLPRNLAAKAFPITKVVKNVREQLRADQFIIPETGGIAHFVPDYADILTHGTNGLRSRVEAVLQRPNLSKGQRDQLAANLIALDSIEQFADRYLALAKQIGRMDVVEILERVPRRPASNLHEALQMIWLFQLTIQVESLDQGISLGRLDQFLYPLYQKEVREGTFCPDTFRDLFCTFCLKLSEVIPLFSNRLTEMFGGLPIGQALTLGGIKENGEDASNELTFLLLDVIDQFKTRQPNWHARISTKSDNAYVTRVFEVVGHGGGSPAVYNDEVIMATMGKRFDAPDRLWDYATIGCVELGIAGASCTSSDAALFNYAKILENILGNNKALGRIHSTAALMHVLEIELRAQVKFLKENLDAIETSSRENHPVPFSSLTVEGCIEQALDFTAGGATFNASGIQAIGLADLANSLAAIDELVFKRCEITLPELAKACKNNFTGAPTLLSKLIRVDKFGNDNTCVDHIANQLMALFDQVLSENVNTRGGHWMAGVYSMTCHRSMGRKMGALPSGRLAGKPLADGIAPADGSDCLGPTASLNSVAQLNPEHTPNGVNLNLKFDANTVKGKAGAMLLQGLIKGYFGQGGMQAQINVLDPKVLLAAKENPDQHRNLLVRISGYSAYFVDLSPEMQDEIITRTLQAA